MKPLSITKEQARRFMLSYHGLSGPSFSKDRDGILEYISRVGCIQFDPLNIVGHNQELVLQSRIEGFRPGMLDELLYKDRKLIDGWDKVMSIYAVSDWPYFSRYRAANLERLGSEDGPVFPYLQRIREEIDMRGPISSIDLRYDEAVSWPWGPARVSRAALESMWFWGEVVIHHKVNTRKYYDFTYRHLPRELLDKPDPNETFGQYRDWRIHRRIGGVGLLWAKPGDAWLEIPQTKTPERLDSIQALLSAGKLTEISVADINVPFYIRSIDQGIMENILSDTDGKSIRSCRGKSEARILAPLDNMLWDRRMIAELFGFDYRWEVYKPESERKYGYYVLPVLYGDRFVARFEPSYDKKSKALTVKNWWWENGVRQTKAMQQALIKCFRRFAGYLGAKSIVPGEAADDSVKNWIRDI
jgi:uncharacterized protein YcaQ